MDYEKLFFKAIKYLYFILVPKNPTVAAFRSIVFNTKIFSIQFYYEYPYKKFLGFIIKCVSILNKNLPLWVILEAWCQRKNYSPSHFTIARRTRETDIYNIYTCKIGNIFHIFKMCNIWMHFCMWNKIGPKWPTVVYFRSIWLKRKIFSIEFHYMLPNKRNR